MGGGGKGGRSKINYMVVSIFVVVVQSLSRV